MGKKSIELKPKADKVSEEMLLKLRGAVNELTMYQLELGKLEVRKHEMLHGYAIAKDRTSLIQQELEKEYGTHDVNITDGTINYNNDAE